MERNNTRASPKDITGTNTNKIITMWVRTKNMKYPIQDLAITISRTGVAVGNRRAEK